jgi:hypothetical protein
LGLLYISSYILITQHCTFKTAVNFLFFIFWNVKKFLFTLTLQFPHQHDKDKIGIKCAYNEKDKFRAHSTRALGPSWALFNGASVKSIMDTADISSYILITQHCTVQKITQHCTFKTAVNFFFFDFESCSV